MAWGEATRVVKAPFDVGYAARIALHDTYDNPHPLGSFGWEAWRRGWNYADDAISSQAQQDRSKGLNRADQRRG